MNIRSCIVNACWQRLLGLGCLLMLVTCLHGGEAVAADYHFSPVSGNITSQFGWRTDPIHGHRRFHSGLDIGASHGTPVYLPQNGTVIFSGPYKGYGNMVVVDHGYNLYTLYAHLSQRYVKTGDTVARGQIIATVGSSGRSTGPHLHFEVHHNQQYVDPLRYLTLLQNPQYMHALATAQPTPQKKVAYANTPSRGIINKPTPTKQSAQIIEVPAVSFKQARRSFANKVELIRGKAKEVIKF